MSFFVAGGVLALGVYGTKAFFSDTETSTGNILTAGALDLQIDSTAHYAGLICNEQGVWAEDAWETTVNTRPELVGLACSGTWALKDLGEENVFFDLSDLKPGDSGENTISIHVDNNPAWLCADVSLTKNDDVTSTEPELEDGDVDEDLLNNFDGELAQNIHFTAWSEQDGDNLWEQGEPLLFSNVEGPASDVLGGKTYALADSLTNGGVPFPGGATSYIGLQWCFGNMTVVTDTNTITCDGSLVDNKTQTDSISADIAFRVEQHRNNPNFVCTPPATAQ